MDHALYFNSALYIKDDIFTIEILPSYFDENELFYSSRVFDLSHVLKRVVMGPVHLFTFSRSIWSFSGVQIFIKRLA